MKRLQFFLCMVTLFSSVLWAEDANQHSFGVQCSSEGYAGLIFHSRFFELAVKGRLMLIDGLAQESPDLYFGGHAGLIFRPFSDPLDLSLGFDFRTAVATDGPDYAEYIDAGPRVAFDYRPTSRVLISAVLNPFWVNTRETEDQEDWRLSVRFPRCSLSLAFLFL